LTGEHTCGSHEAYKRGPLIVLPVLVARFHEIGVSAQTVDFSYLSKETCVYPAIV
jgi:hypothetical protein